VIAAEFAVLLRLLKKMKLFKNNKWKQNMEIVLGLKFALAIIKKNIFILFDSASLKTEIYFLKVLKSIMIF